MENCQIDYIVAAHRLKVAVFGVGVEAAADVWHSGQISDSFE